MPPQMYNSAVVVGLPVIVASSTIADDFTYFALSLNPSLQSSQSAQNQNHLFQGSFLACVQGTSLVI